MKKGSSPAPVLSTQPDMTTPEPSGVMYEAPPPPPLAATARFDQEAERFVPIAPGGTAPAFPMLGTKIETPPTGYSRVLLAALFQFETKTKVELETLKASSSESSSDVMTLTPLFPWNDGILHVPSSDRRGVRAKRNHFLQPKEKTFDELIDEATKA